MSAIGPDSDRALDYARNFCSRLGLPPAAIEIQESVPTHAGLGSGTQLALAVGMGLTRLCGLPPDIHRIAHITDRGIRSDVGVGVFEAGLVGFNGLDALVREKEFVVLEVNPRPGATFELYETKCADSFFAMHLRACNGELPSESRISSAAQAHAVVYAPRSVVISESQGWPYWCSDLSMPGTAIAAGAPLCMVHANRQTAAHAHRLVLARKAQVSQWFAHNPSVGAGAQAPVTTQAEV